MPKQTKIEKFFDFKFDKAKKIEEMSVPEATAHMNPGIVGEIRNYEAADEVVQGFTILKAGHYSLLNQLTVQDKEARLKDVRDGLGITVGEGKHYNIFRPSCTEQHG